MSDAAGSRPIAVSQAWYRDLGIDRDDDLWTIPLAKGPTYIRFKPIRRNWGDVLTDHVKDAALAYFENRSADTVGNGVFFLARMSRHVSVDGTISASTLMNYRSRLPPEQLHYLGHVASFLKFWVERGYPGVDRDVLHFFNSVKIPGNLKGTAVRTHHPTKGPFTDVELQGVLLTAPHCLIHGLRRLEKHGAQCQSVLAVEGLVVDGHSEESRIAERLVVSLRF